MFAQYTWTRSFARPTRRSTVRGTLKRKNASQNLTRKAHRQPALASHRHPGQLCRGTTDLGARAFKSAPMVAKASPQVICTYLSFAESQHIGSVSLPISSSSRSDQLSSSVKVCLAKNSGGTLFVRYFPRRGLRAVLTKFECTEVRSTTIRAADTSKASGLVLMPKRERAL